MVESLGISMPWYSSSRMHTEVSSQRLVAREVGQTLADLVRQCCDGTIVQASAGGDFL